MLVQFLAGVVGIPIITLLLTVILGKLVSSPLEQSYRESGGSSLPIVVWCVLMALVALGSTLVANEALLSVGKSLPIWALLLGGGIVMSLEGTSMGPGVWVARIAGLAAGWWAVGQGGALAAWRALS
jgi:hypothetical protein